MNCVFWLGAGASAGSEVPNWPRKPPTIKRFFQAGQSLGLNGDEYFRGLFALMQERWGVKEEVLIREGTEVTIETALSLFEAERQLHPLEAEKLLNQDYLNDHYAFDRAQELLRRYIREVLYGSGAVPDHPRGGCPLHASIAEHLGPSDAVISFNYDLIVDKALADTGRWNEWAGYAPMTFDRIYDVGHWHAAMPTRRDFPSVSELTYLKLHGSINWFRSTGMRATPQSAELDRLGQDPDHPQRRVISLFSSRAAARELMNAEAFFEGQSVEQSLVPPTMHKDYEMFRPLWKRAEEALASAKQLVIVGFSFAPADIQAQWLLRRGLTRNPNAVSVTLVDLDDQVRQRIKAVVASIHRRHSIQGEHRSLKDFVSAHFQQIGQAR